MFEPSKQQILTKTDLSVVSSLKLRLVKALDTAFGLKVAGDAQKHERPGRFAPAFPHSAST
jgi:hypothetical protein